MTPLIIFLSVCLALVLTFLVAMIVFWIWQELEWRRIKKFWNGTDEGVDQ